MESMKELLSHPNPRDREQVEVLVAMGASLEFIADELYISPEELETHYAKAISHGSQRANLEVAQTFFELAKSGKFPNLTVSWMELRAGWSKAPDASSRRSPEELEELRSVAKEKLSRLLNRGT